MPFVATVTDVRFCSAGCMPLAMWGCTTVAFPSSAASAREHHTDGRVMTRRLLAVLRRAPGKMVVHNSAGIMPGGDVGH
jgi:hypothetical protein